MEAACCVHVSVLWSSFLAICWRWRIALRVGMGIFLSLSPFQCRRTVAGLVLREGSLLCLCMNPYCSLATFPSGNVSKSCRNAESDLLRGQVIHSLKVKWGGYNYVSNFNSGEESVSLLSFWTFEMLFCILLATEQWCQMQPLCLWEAVTWQVCNGRCLQMPSAIPSTLHCLELQPKSAQLCFSRLDCRDYCQLGLNYIPTWGMCVYGCIFNDAEHVCHTALLHGRPCHFRES